MESPRSSQAKLRPEVWGPPVRDLDPGHTGLLVGTFALSLFVIQRGIAGFVGEDSALGIATSTLLVAALFNPPCAVVSRIQ